MTISKVPLTSKIALIILLLLAIAGCKRAYTTPYQPNPGNMLQVELRMPEPWKKIVIGPAHSIEYPNIPHRFSIFMTGESTGALKPYLLIEDSTVKEYSFLLITVTHVYKSQTEIYPVKCEAYLTGA